MLTRNMAGEVLTAVGQLRTGVEKLINQNKQSVATNFLKFSGDSLENGKLFIAQFTNHATFCGWNDDMKLLAFPVSLYGAAAIWYSRLADGNKDTWAHLQLAFEAEYVTKPTRDIMQQIQYTKMEKGDKVDAYSRVMLELFSRVTRTDSDLVHYYIDGLPSKIKTLVLMQNPLTPQSAVQLAKQAERAVQTEVETSTADITDLKNTVDKLAQQLVQIRSTPTSESVSLSTISDNASSLLGGCNVFENNTPWGNRPYNNSSTNNNRQSGRTRNGQPFCTNCGQQGHLSYTCQSPRLCFRCGRPGHVRAQCRVRLNDQQSRQYTNNGAFTNSRRNNGNRQNRLN